MSQSQKLILPKIQKVKLYRFSLYSLEPNIEIDIKDGVFCLAGANGLGKSTFLAAINFALTSIVPDPSRKFMSVEEYYIHCLGYSNEYFTGRITEDDREAATITLCLQIGEKVYQLTKGVFEPEELREFYIYESVSGEFILDGKELTNTQRQQKYEENITNDIGLASFQQFVFLQNFVLTFDERRQLLLWDKNILNQALFLGIGTDFEKAQKADSLRRERDKHDSLARNHSWQVSGLRSEIALLRKAISAPESEVSFEEAKMKHKALYDELMQKKKEVEHKRRQLDDAKLKHMEATSELTSLQTQYTQEFAMQVQQRSRVELHPLIKNTISAVTCSLCGNQGDTVIEAIKGKINKNICPLCDSPILEKATDNTSIATLKEIDKEIDKTKKQLDLSNKSLERINLELQTAEAQLEGMSSVLQDFESANESLMLQLRGEASNVSLTIQKKHEEMERHLKKKYEEYAKRDEKQNQLLELFHELKQRYNEVEKDFIPRFKELASLFIGIDLDIRTEYSTSMTYLGMSFTLEMQGEVRRQLYQLSESQRFFLDIALRMALAEYMSSPIGRACLFVDTPEGSLDIAYESRAGQMFATFVQNDHDIVMTANINTSQLLRRMATICGRSQMTLHRMISWAPLSDVQMEEEDLFEQAYDQIEAALDSKKV